MNVPEVQKEITRLSPAAGRVSTHFVQEIERLNDLVSSQNLELSRRQAAGEALERANAEIGQLRRGVEAGDRVIAELREALNSQAEVMAQQNTELTDLRSFTRQVRYELDAAGAKPQEGVELLSQLRDWLEGEEQRRDTVVSERLTQVMVVISGVPPKANRDLHATIDAYCDKVLYEVAQFRTELEAVKAEKLRAQQAHARLIQEIQQERGNILLQLQRFISEERRQTEITIPPSHAAFTGALSTILHLMDQEQRNRRLEIEATQSGKLMEESCAELHRALGGEDSPPRPAAVLEWWDHLIGRVRGLTDLYDRLAASEEALTNALNHNRELEQALTELKPHSYDIDGVQAEAQGLAEAFDRTHTALLQMQDGYIGEHTKRLKLRRDLRQAQADIEFLKTASSMAAQRLQAVDMALRGEAADIETVSPFRTPTLDLAERIWTRLGDYRRVAEREVSWRQEVERERDDFAKQLRAYQKDGYLKRVDKDNSVHVSPEAREAFRARMESAALDGALNSAGRPIEEVKIAECGQPFPCEHAPDGGPHPKVNILGQWRAPVDPPSVHENPMDRGGDPGAVA